MSVRYLCLIAIAAVLGCATGSGTPKPSRNPNLLTAKEIESANVSTAYDAVERLRPLFLHSRGEISMSNQRAQFATVYLNGQRYGDLSSLRSLLASQVLEIRYYSVAEGAARFGLMNAGGVIDVKLK